MAVAQHEDENNRDDTAAKNQSHSASTSTGWKGWKERGKQAYLRGEYASALQSYSQAAQRQQNPIHGVDNVSDENSPSSTILDRQILLSNMVACRLKLGGAAQSEAAVVTAKKCVALNPLWPKGHMRLAEAYLSLSESSDGASCLEISEMAREAFERVIDLDPGNQSARDQLAKLDWDRGVGNNDHQSNTPAPSAPPEYMDHTRYNNTQEAVREEGPTLRRRNNSNRSNSSSSSSSSSNNNNNPSRNTSFGDVNIEDDDNVYENYAYTPSWQDRLASKMRCVKSWYHGLSGDQKSIVKVLLFFVVLYVAFGGRFGLEYVGRKNTGTPYHRSNTVYEDFYRSRSEDSRRYHSSQSYQRSSSSSGGSSQYRSDYYGSHRSPSRSSWDMYNLSYFLPFVILALSAGMDLPIRGMRRRRHFGWGGNGYPRYGHRRRGGMWGW